MKLLAHVQHLPLRHQLMGGFAALSIATTAITAVTLASQTRHGMNEGLRDKSVQYARQLQRQLAPVIAFDDHLTAREVFESVMDDHDVDGLGVYSDSGELLEGRGVRPGTLSSINADLNADKGHVIAVAEIKSREGRSGRLFVSLTSKAINEVERRNAWFAAAIAAAVMLCALLLAGQISRRIANRLGSIADAAKRMAAGDRAHVALDDSAKDEVGALAHAFNIMVCELNRVSAEHDRLVATERERLERLVSERTQALEQSREMFRLVAESTKAIPFTLDLTRGAFPYIGAQGVADFDIPEEEWRAPGALDRAIPRDSNSDIRQRFDACAAGPFEFLATLHHSSGAREVRWMGTCEVTRDGRCLRGLMLDITEVRRLGRELAAAQKLESVGRLAAGVAHEINTPVQFVADNMGFVRESMTGVADVIQAYRDLKQAVQTGGDAAAAASVATAAETEADLDYVIANVPPAIAGAIEGLGRIATIVRSMKEFAHPDQSEKTSADLNHAIQSTLIIARNEYKYVAEVETDFGELPPVQCYLGEINQVVLNLLVNAAHAISDVVKDSGSLGKLTVRTRLEGDEVEISIGDTGTGIPEAARDKIFDPFFTTKEVGKGTGQGLAIARSVIVNKHGGTLRFETECGRGTTFFIRFPVGACDDHSSVDQAAA
jgi:signal transduction histidine kinase/HAMP domain-containing protein